jgi:hypothetical protein
MKGELMSDEQNEQGQPDQEQETFGGTGTATVEEPVPTPEPDHEPAHEGAEGDDA